MMRFRSFSCLVALLLLAGCASSQNGASEMTSPSPSASASASGGGSDQARIVRAVALVRPSVVALNVVINGTLVVPRDPFQRFFGGTPGPIRRQFREQASGSGFVYDRSGLIVTNSHVVHNASSITVVFANGDKVRGSLFAENVGADLALVRVQHYAHLPAPVVFGSSGDVQQGEWAIAIGEPFALQQTVTLGVVSAFNRTEMIGGETGAPARQFSGLLQTSAPINPGNSGGPLIDIAGHLIGVNQSTANPASGAQGIGFAIPVDTVRTVVEDLVRHPGSHSGTSSGFIGVQLVPLNDNVRAQIGYNGNGAVIAGVINGSAAQRAGLQAGDVIEKIDGNTVNSVGDVVTAMQKVRPGQTVRLQIWSNGTVRTVTVTVTGRTP